MYKLLLCLRYLRTRFIALASIVSVMLGVATMVVVNSVMSGFAREMESRLQAIHADISIETNSLNGEAGPEPQMQLARQVAGDAIESMSASVQVFGLLHFRRGGQWIPRPIELVGIDPETEARVTPLAEYLDSYRQIVSDDGVLIRRPLRPAGQPPSWELTPDALAWRTDWKLRQRRFFEQWEQSPFESGAEDGPGDGVPAGRLMPDEPVFEPEPGMPPFESEPVSAEAVQTASGPSPDALPDPSGPAPADQPAVREGSGIVPAAAQSADDRVQGNPFAEDVVPADLVRRGDESAADIDAPLPGRLYVGAGLIEVIRQDPRTGKIHTERMVHPGDDVKISTVSAGSPPEPRHFFATVVDVFKSGMSEYDSNQVYCNLEYLQQIRGMVDPQTKQTAVTTIKIRLKNYDDAPRVLKQLRGVFPPHLYTVRTWEEKQGPLLAAVDIEQAILNVLLFLIIAVAGFGILAIFCMIVVEKTRDIGILKALGASSRGVMSIFVSYGLALGIVGSGTGIVLGLLFVRHINEIEGLLAALTGRKVFDERIYYFPSIPTEVNPLSIAWIALGAVLIAVLASVLPARRAARLHPVEALRYE